MRHVPSHIVYCTYGAYEVMWEFVSVHVDLVTCCDVDVVGSDMELVVTCNVIVILGQVTDELTF